MIPQEILKKIHAIQVRTDHMIDSGVAGEYESIFQGRGMEFEEVREYQPGDDIRTIDWNVTARMNAPFVKVYREERELTIILLVDASASTIFGSQSKLKKEVAAELAAILAYIAIKNNDKVGLVLFTDQVERYIPPKKGKSHVFRVIREVLTHEPKRRGTNINAALNHLLTVQHKRTVSFLISDFIDSDFSMILNLASKKHDLSGIMLRDQREEVLPDIGLVELVDAESGESILIDAHHAATREYYQKKAVETQTLLKQSFKKLGIDAVDAYSHESLLEPVLKLFRMRIHK